MMGLTLLCVIAIAIPQEDDPALRYQIDQLLFQLRSLQGSVQQKESVSVEQDKMISHLQRQLQGVKGMQYEATLKKHQGELSTLQDKIQNLISDVERLDSKYQHLKGLSAEQRKQLDETHLALHLVEEQIMHSRAQADQNAGIFLTEIWSSTTLSNIWKRTVLVAGQWYRVMHESRFSKTLAVLEEQISMLMQKAQKDVEEKTNAASEAFKVFLIKFVRAFGSHLSQPDSIMQPYLSKVSQLFNKGLKYGINSHLQLQRTIRKTMQRNKYLQSKESKEVVWFLASALLIIPLYGALLLSSFIGERRRPPKAKAIVHKRRRHAIQLRRSERFQTSSRSESSCW